eukprot:63083-Amphidinium_carterae.1
MVVVTEVTIKSQALWHMTSLCIGAHGEVVHGLAMLPFDVYPIFKAWARDYKIQPGIHMATKQTGGPYNCGQHTAELQELAEVPWGVLPSCAT